MSSYSLRYCNDAPQKPELSAIFNIINTVFIIVANSPIVLHFTTCFKQWIGLYFIYFIHSIYLYFILMLLIYLYFILMLNICKTEDWQDTKVHQCSFCSDIYAVITCYLKHMAHLQITQVRTPLPTYLI